MKLTLTYAHHPLSRTLAQHFLEQGHEVQLLTPSALMPESPFWSAHMPVIPCDFESSTLLKKHLHGQDLVFNLHGESSADEDPVSHSLSLFHGALQNDVRVIHFSTHQVYGLPLYVPLDENHPLMGTTPLTQASMATDMLAKSFAQSFALPIVILRLFPVLNDETLIDLMHYLCSQKELKNQYLDLMREADLLSCLFQVMQHDDYTGQIFNVASGSLMSTRFLQRIAAPYTEHLKALHTVHQNRPGYLPIDFQSLLKQWNGRQGDPEAIANWTGWKVQHTTPEALKIWVRLHTTR